MAIQKTRLSIPFPIENRIFDFFFQKCSSKVPLKVIVNMENSLGNSSATKFKNKKIMFGNDHQTGIGNKYLFEKKCSN